MAQDPARELLEKVRSLDDDAKRKVLVISSAAAMVVVIAVWLAYFNSIVMPTASNVAASTSTAPAAAAPAPASSTASSSSPAAANGFSSAWEGFLGIFTGGNHYINPESQ